MVLTRLGRGGGALVVFCRSVGQSALAAAAVEIAASAVAANPVEISGIHFFRAVEVTINMCHLCDFFTNFIEINRISFGSPGQIWSSFSTSAGIRRFY